MSENKITFPVKLASNNPQSFGIVDAIEVSGHKSVDTLSDLYAISDQVLSVLKDGSDAIGQEWFVVSEDCKYRLDNWENRKSLSGWIKLPKQELINTKQSVSEKDQPDGYAGLDSNGKLPIEKTYGTTATVVDVETYESLPVAGLSGVIYYVSNTSAQYKWSGSAYIDITDGADNAKKNETSIFDCSNGTSTKYYSSLSEAINVVPPVYRTSNRIISYLSTENSTTTAVNYQYHGIDSTTWTNLTKWERVPNQADLAEIRSDLNETITALVVYDVSSHSDGAVFESLSDLLGSANLSTLIPTLVRRGGMSIRFIQGSVLNSDNKYVQYRCKSQPFSNNPEDWAFEGDDVYVNDPEFIKAECDAKGTLLFWIKADGSIDWAIGIPKPVKEYVGSYVSDVSELLNTKVDKEVLKSLINSDFASSQDVVEDLEYMKIETDNTGKILGGRKTNGTVVENMPLDTPSAICSSEQDEEWIEIKTTIDGKIIYGLKRNGKFYISKIENDDINVLLERVNIKAIPANEIDSIENLGTPETCISTSDADVTPYDNLYIGYCQVLKISDELYYMYYDSAGAGDDWYEYGGIVYSNTHGLNTKFAYSTDGINWTRGFPQGIGVPEQANGENACVFLVNGTNQGIGSCCIIKAYWDREYPFRAISSDGSMYMWKSQDGITFTDRKLIDDTWRDCQPSAIIRGNVIKIYNRCRPAAYRHVAVLYCDLDGNVLSPSRYLFGGDNIYQSSGGMLDERRDILFPTTFKETHLDPYDGQGINCYIVDGKEVIPVPIEQEVFTEDGRFKCVYAATGGLVEIKKTVNGEKIIEQYLYYCVSENHHNVNIKLPLKYSSVSEFPVSGDTSKIYVDTSTWKNYEWNGSEYEEMNPVYLNEIRRVKIDFGNDLYVSK